MEYHQLVGVVIELLQGVPQYHCGFRFYVEVGDPLAEGQGAEHSVLVLCHPLLDEELHHVLHSALYAVEGGLAAVERVPEEVYDIIHGGHLLGGDQSEDVHLQHALVTELRCYLLGIAFQIVLQQVLEIILAPGHQHGFAVGVVSRPSGASAHLFDLHHGDGGVARGCLEPRRVPDDDPSGGKVDARRKGGGRHYDLKLPRAEVGFHVVPLLRGESRVVERRTALHAGRELPADGGALRFPFQYPSVLFGQHDRTPRGDGGGVSGGEGLGGSAGVHEHYAQTSRFYHVIDKCQQLILLIIYPVFAAVGEGDPPVVVDAFLELYRAPVALYQFCIEPHGEIVGIGYGGGQCYDLEVGIPAFHLGEGDLQRGTPSRIVEHVYLVGNDQSDGFYPSAAVAHQRISFLRCCDDHVGIGELPVVGVQIPNAYADGYAQMGEPVEVVPLFGC